MCQADAIFHVEQLKNCRAVEIRAVAIRAVDPDSIVVFKKQLDFGIIQFEQTWSCLSFEVGFVSCFIPVGNQS